MNLAGAKIETAKGPWQLPAGWTWAYARVLPMGNVGTFDPQKAPAGKVTLYSVPSYDGGKPEIVEAGSVESTKQIVAPGCVLVCKINPGISRCWVVGELHDSRPTIASTEWIVIKPNDLVIPDYVKHFVLTERVRQYFTANVSGVGGSLMRINATTLADLQLPIPPLPEQRRIVERIDALFGEIAEGEAALAEARKGLDLFRRSLLKAAVTGELTRDWREANKLKESGVDALARIIGRREGCPGSGKRRRPAVSDPGLQSEGSEDLPTGWILTPLPVIANIGTGATPKRGEPRFWDDGNIPWLTSAATNHPFVFTSDQFITEAGSRRDELSDFPPRYAARSDVRRGENTWTGN